jgi:hypothetical protein
MENGTGYDVVVWFEEQVTVYDNVLPKILIHTSNPSASIKMKNAVEKINKMVSERK